MTSIASQSLCSGCGVCASACPKGCIRIHETEEGVFRPQIDSKHCIDCGLCMKVCPHEIEASKEDLVFSNISSCLAGRFPESTENTASGGGVSWFLCTLLHLGMVDAVIHVIPSKEQGVWFNYGISKTPEEIHAGAGSAYCPVSLNEVLDKIRQHPNMRYAVVGLPCFISALDNLRKINSQYKQQLTILVGLVCGHLPSRLMTKCLAWQAGKASEDIQTVRYHIHDGQRPAWNYGIELKYHDGSVSTSFGDGDFGFLFWHGLFSQKACLNCQDIFAQNADIVFMDAWLSDFKEKPNGTSLLAVRNKDLLPIFDDLLEKGAIKQMPIQCLEESQHSLIEKRKSMNENTIGEKWQLIEWISLLCRNKKSKQSIVEKIRLLEYTEKIKDSKPILHWILRLKQHILWHV